MLTGKPAFEGERHADDRSRGCIEREPDMEQAAIRFASAPCAALLRALPRKRIRRNAVRDIGDVRLALEQALAAPQPSAGVAETPSAPQLTRGSRVRWIAFGATAATAVLMAIGIAGVTRYWPVRETVRFEVPVPRASDPHALALSPDGRFLAYAAGASPETTMLFARPLDAIEARLLPGTEGARERPFWSADSRHLGFAAGGQLKRVALAEGPPQILTEVGPVFFGGAWGAGDVILFAAGAGTALKRVSAAGGEVVDATTLDLSVGEESHGAPLFFPDGRRFLYGTATGMPGVLRELTEHERQEAAATRFCARAEYGSGFLVLNREGALFAQAFDIDRQAFSGEAERLAGSIAWTPPGIGAFSVTGTGVLAYRVESDRAVEQSRLVWYGPCIGSRLHSA